MDYKPAIISHLELLRKKEVANKEVWKAKAYAKVIKTLKELHQPINSFEDVQALPGVGDKISKKIREIIETGSLKQTNGLKDDIGLKAIDQLMQIHGIGAVKARELVLEKNIVSIEQLEEKKDHVLNDKQKLGLKYFKDMQQRIPRTEMDKHCNYITNTIANISKELRVMVAGSYRRGARDSGDVDVLVSCPFDYDPPAHVLKTISDKMIADKYISDVLAIGDKKCFVVSKLKYHRTYRRVDLMFTRPEEFPFAVLYFTGSQSFNILMRTHALQKGYSLNEYGLKNIKTGDLVDCRFDSEEDIFKFLDLEFVKPDQREHVIVLKTL